jgi:hypothetical protein
VKRLISYGIRLSGTGYKRALSWYIVELIGSTVFLAIYTPDPKAGAKDACLYKFDCVSLPISI